MTCREDGCLVEQVGQIGPRKTRGAAGPGRKRHRPSQGAATGMNRKDRLTAAAIWQVNGDAAVKTTGPHQGAIEHIRSVCGRQQNYAGVIRETIHLGEQLVEGLLPLIVAATDTSTSLATDRIYFVDENDAGRFGFGLAK